MSKNLSVERTYSLGQYQNIKLHDSVDLPDELAFNKDLVNEVRFLQLLQLEIDFRRYITLYEKLHPYSMEEALGYLEEVKLKTLDIIKDLFDDTNP